MRTYYQSCPVRWQQRPGPVTPVIITAELSFRQGDTTVKLRLGDRPMPWLLNHQELYRLVYGRSTTISADGILLQRNEELQELHISDSLQFVAVPLDALEAFLEDTFREPPLEVRRPIEATVTLAGEDTERKVEACLSFSSEVGYDVLLDLGSDYDCWECGREALLEGIEEEAVDGLLVIGPSRFHRLPIQVLTEEGQLEYTIELETGEVAAFLAETERLVPPGQERSYDPDQFTEELGRWLDDAA